MSDQNSRQLYERFGAFITAHQREFLDKDGTARYPQLAAKHRHISPSLRDVIDFAENHYPLFLTWIASKGRTPQEPNQ